MEELLKMGAAIAEDHSTGTDLGLSVEEKAFYDALLQPAAIKDFYMSVATSITFCSLACAYIGSFDI